MYVTIIASQRWDIFLRHSVDEHSIHIQNISNRLEFLQFFDCCVCDELVHFWLISIVTYAFSCKKYGFMINVLMNVAVVTSIIITRPHHSTTYVDVVYCYQPSSVVCLSVGLSH